MTHIIVCGPDGAGKTTLALKLCELFHYNYRHEGPPPADASADYYRQIIESVTAPTVFDRFQYGELVYGPLLRGRAILTFSNALTIPALTIICLPPFVVCEANLHAKELIVDVSMRARAYAQWQELAERIPNALTVDYTGRNYVTHPMAPSTQKLT